MGHSDQYLTTVNSVGLVFNAFARLLGGTILDFLDFKIFVGILMAISISLSLTIVQVGTDAAVFMVYLCLAHFIMGSIFVGMPTFYAQIFGAELGSQTYSYFFTSSCFSTLLLALIVSLFQAVIGYEGMFNICMGCSVIALLVVLVMNTSPYSDQDDKMMDELFDSFGDDIPS